MAVWVNISVSGNFLIENVKKRRKDRPKKVLHEFPSKNGLRADFFLACKANWCKRGTTRQWLISPTLNLRGSCTVTTSQIMQKH